MYEIDDVTETRDHISFSLVAEFYDVLYDLFRRFYGSVEDLYIWLLLQVLLCENRLESILIITKDNEVFLRKRVVLHVYVGNGGSFDHCEMAIFPLFGVSTETDAAVGFVDLEIHTE